MTFKADSATETVKQDSTVKELLQLILIELRISNKYNELGFDEIIDEDSTHEDRRR